MRGHLVVSIDVEDWPQSSWDRNLEITPRADVNTHRVLDILAECDRRATLFVLGKFAERFPDTVRRMVREGHEVASHGYGHIEIFKQTRAQFLEDITRSKSLLEDICGRRVTGYRAPDFSIIKESLWALDVLTALGFEYDSSIFPIRMARYGIDGWPDDPSRIRLESGSSIVELPIASLDVRGKRIPVGGGGYHRLLPWPMIHLAIRTRLSGRELFMSYCHPYEFDPAEMAEIPMKVPVRTRLHQGLGRRGFRSKFVKMLAAFPTTTATDMAARESWPELKLAAGAQTTLAAA